MLLPALALALVAAPALDAQVPLTHSAPFLGDVFWVHVEGLPTGSLVWLYASPSAASIPTPYGTVGIDPATAVPIATNQAAFPGTVATMPFLLPPDPTWAEAELHLQAFAIDFAQPPNVYLSEAASLRLLGSRVVAEQERILEFGGPSERRLAVLRGDTLQPAFTAPIAGHPVGARDLELSPDARFAAYRYGSAVGLEIATAGAVVRFEHFFGAAVAEDTLVTRGEWVEAPWGDAWLVYGRDPSFGPGWDLWSLPYDPALAPTPLGIGGEAGPMVAELSADAAWIPDAPEPTGEPRMKRVSLTTGATLESVVVGAPGQTTVQWAELDGQRLLCGTLAPPQGPGENFAQVSWVDWATAPDVVNAAPLNRAWTRYDGRLSLTGDLLFWGWTNFGFPAISVGQFLTDPALPGVWPPQTQPPPFNSPTVVIDQGSQVLVFDRCCDDPPDDDGLAWLWRLDPLTGVLSPGTPSGQLVPVTSPAYNTYVSMAATDDPTGPRHAFGSCGLTVVPFSFSEEHLLQVDPFTGAQAIVSTDLWSNWWLEGVSAP